MEEKITVNWNKIIQELIVGLVLLGFMSIGITTVLCTYLGIAFSYSASITTFWAILGVLVAKALFMK